MAQRAAPGAAWETLRHVPGGGRRGTCVSGRVMLSRTADSLYWLARYMERADFLARIIDATRRLATLPRNYAGPGTEWESALEASGASSGFYKTHTAATEPEVVDYLSFAPDNPSSIR